VNSTLEGQNLNMAKKSYENMAELKCFGTTLTDQNCILKKLKTLDL
jgi:hypothetical protein